MQSDQCLLLATGFSGQKISVLVKLLFFNCCCYLIPSARCRDYNLPTTNSRKTELGVCLQFLEHHMMFQKRFPEYAVNIGTKYTKISAMGHT